MHEDDQNFRYMRAVEDHSHLIVETWSQLVRNLLLTALVAATAWTFTSALLWSIEHAHEWLFHPFKTGGHPRVITLGQHTFHITPMTTILTVLLIGGILRDIILYFSSAWFDVQGDGVKIALEQFYEAHKEERRGTPHPNEYRYKKPTFMAAIRRIGLTFLTIGTGGSGGLEGPVIPVGEAIASGWSKFFKIESPDDLRFLQMSGISAAFATLLNAPYMSAIFAAEVIFSDRLIYRPLFYSLVAALIAYFCNNHFLHISPLFTFRPHAQFYSPSEYFYASFTAIVISAPAALGLRFLFERLKKIIMVVPSILRATTGAILTGAVAWVVWSVWHISPVHILGVGERTMSAVYEGTLPAALQAWGPLLTILLAKAIATGFTLMAGGSAGLLIPAMFMGGVSGAIVYDILINTGFHLHLIAPEVFIVAGVASSLVAIIEVPIAAIAFVLEGFGAALAPPSIAACVVCHLLVKRLKLYK